VADSRDGLYLMSLHEDSSSMRSGVWHIGTITGIPVKVHISFVLVFLIFAFPNIGLDEFWRLFLWDSLFVLLLFSCVLLHEFGHALTARRYGVGTREIVLLPIGGLAMLEHLPEKPVQELVIALAGPAVNFVIALVLSAYFLFYPVDQLIAYANRFGPAPIFAHPLLIIPVLMLTNLMLGVFNLIPAFPMDGGRVLRALLAIRVGRVNATRIATGLGQLFAAGFVALAFYTSSVLVGIIGLFIFFAARRELKVVRTTDFLKSTSFSQIAHLPPLIVLYEEQTVSDAAEAMLQGQDWPILVQDGQGSPAGVIEPVQLQPEMVQSNPEAPVRSLMNTQFAVLYESVSLQAAIDSGARLLLVLHKSDHSPICVLNRASLTRLIAESSNA
jgi:Zn-dependent protease